MAQRKTIKLKFVDYFGQKPEETFVYQILSRSYDIELAQSPDYVISGGLGREYRKYDCLRIGFIGESYCPDFNQFDYAIGFDHLTFGDRYVRIPLYAVYGEFRYLSELRRQIAEDVKAGRVEKYLKRDFCSFVVSNADGDPARLEFFRELSKYRPVASGGRLLNNVGGPVADKNHFLMGYKFNLAFENSCVPGYTTEKILQPLAVGSVPVYYGNPRIADDFDSACMVRVSDRNDFGRAIEEIVALDRDDDAYLARLVGAAAVRTADHYEKALTEFLRNIFDQPLASARRLNEYGYQLNFRKRPRFGIF